MLKTLSVDVLQSVLHGINKKRSRDAAYLSSAKRRKVLRSLPTPPDIWNKGIHLESAQLLSHAGLDAGLKAQSMKVCDSMVEASVFLVTDITLPTINAKWAAALCGGVLCEPAFILQGGKGPCVTLKPAIATNMTTLFVQAHPLAAKIAVARLVACRKVDVVLNSTLLNEKLFKNM